jgi:hypothetical protein
MRCLEPRRESEKYDLSKPLRLRFIDIVGYWHAIESPACRERIAWDWQPDSKEKASPHTFVPLVKRKGEGEGAFGVPEPSFEEVKQQ